MEMANKVVKSLMSNYEKAMKGVESVMGGTVLEYKAKTIYREGSEETLVGTLKKLMKNLGIGIDQAMKLVEIPESDYPKYRRLVDG
ncbi:MAG: hypothetical protein LUG24_06540 [Clostridiales bacterium]|nr:hypothetical protein [Clostridiales bacterium]